MAIVGAGNYTYEVVDDWAKLPAEMELGMVSSVATDNLDRVFAFIRTADQPSMLVLDRNGRYVNSWGTGVITDAHGLSFNSQGDVYLTDRNPHQVMKFSAWGQRLMTLGTRDVAGEQTPFNRPSDVMEGPSGCFYVSDGYGNSCVHKYANDGLILNSWGSPGDGEGQFNLPHGIWVDEHEHVYVCDRENNRIQIFDGNGNLLDIWNDFSRPTDIAMDSEGTIYVSGIGHRCSILTHDGELLARWGGEAVGPVGVEGTAHGIGIDSRGDVYLCAAGARKIQKLVRQPS